MIEFILNWDSPEKLGHTRPVSLEIFGNTYTGFKSWADVWFTVCSIMEEKHGDISSFNLPSCKGRRLFSSNQDALIRPRHLKSSGYVEVNYSPKDVGTLIRELLRFFGYDPYETKLIARTASEALLSQNGIASSPDDFTLSWNSPADLAHTKPVSFSMFGETHTGFKSWADVWFTVCSIMEEKNGDISSFNISSRKGGRRLFSNTPDALIRPRQLKISGYVEVNYSPKDVGILIREIICFFGYDITDATLIARKT